MGYTIIDSWIIMKDVLTMDKSFQVVLMVCQHMS